MQPLTAEQVGKFLEAAKKHRLYPAFELELGTGLRRGELLALRWQDVDLQKGTVTVRRSLLRVRVGEKKTELRFSEPKTEKGKRTIPIPKRVVSILAAHRKQVIADALKLGQKFKEDWLLFSVPFNRPIDPDNFGRQYARLLKKAGIPHRAFHNLRHTVATILLEKGEHPKIVQELLGHARVGITLDIYSHANGEIMQKAASKLDEALNEAEEKAKFGGQK
jgi:integrase